MYDDLDALSRRRLWTLFSTMAATGNSYWTAFVLVGIAIIAVNIFVIITFIRFRSKILRRKNNRILLSLASADTFVGVFSIAFAASMLADQEEAVYKSLGNIPLFGSMFVSIFSLILLTFDRLLAIVQPLQYLSIVTGKRLLMCLISSWSLALLLLAQQYILYYNFSLKVELKVRGILLVACFFVGATVLGVGNYFLFAAIRKHAAKLNIDSIESRSDVLDQDNGMEKSMNMFLNRRKKAQVKKSDLTASKECFYIVVIFIFSLLPLSVYRLLYTCGISLNHRHARRVFLILALLSSFINPWIYFFKKRQFRQYFALRFKQDTFNEEQSFAL